MSKARILVALVIFVVLHVVFVSALAPPRYAPPRYAPPRYHPRNVTRSHSRFRPHNPVQPQNIPHNPVKPRNIPHNVVQPQNIAPPTMTPVEQDFLRAHNYWRMQVNVPPLEWNSTLALYASNWAIKRKYDCYYRHHSRGPYGENTFWEQYDEYAPSDVVKSWYEERMFFDHQRNVCRCPIETDLCQCSHYLALVWKTTKQVGCGEVTCDLERGRLVVCSYFPQGNYRFSNPFNPAL